MLKKFIKNPIGTVKRAFFKLVSGPAKYGQGEGYQEEKYWNDRFAKYQDSILGPGEEGLSEAENLSMYQSALNTINELIQKFSPDIRNESVFEIGLGNGFFTRAFYEMGIRNYQGFDITDVLFEQHQTFCADYTFTKSDIATQKLEGKAKHIFLLDVIQHIVEKEKFQHALQNVWNALEPGGVLYLTPILEKSDKKFFYLATWSREDILTNLPGFEILRELPYRESSLMVVKKTIA